jgi:hypothetical protein
MGHRAPDRGGEAVGALYDPASAAMLWSSPAVLSPAERAMLEGLPEQDRPLRFIEVWTRKEALAKCDGRGLGLDPSAICLATGRRPEGLEGRHLSGLNLGEGLCLALAEAAPAGPAALCRLDSLPETAALFRPGWVAERSTALRADAA